MVVDDSIGRLSLCWHVPVREGKPLSRLPVHAL